MKLRTKLFATLVVTGGIVLPLTSFAQGVANKPGKRSVEIIEDRNQNFMTSKVYELKNTLANDLRPFVEGAVKRYDSESSVARMNYKAGGKQFLVVNMPADMVPYVDDMVKKLDRASKKDENGSTVQGTGIYRFTYKPKFRSTQAMLSVMQGRFNTTEGDYYRDTGTNMFIWKDSKSDGGDGLKWMKALDRPVPQVAMKIRIYEVNENDLKELGVDYVSWKNGPGAELFSVGADILSLNANEELMSSALDVVSASQYAWGGWMLAPSFDASFLRLLAQKGKAKVATSGVLNVANDFTDPGTTFANATYRITMTPQFQNISKDGNQAISVADVAAGNSTYQFHLRSPAICFNNDASEAAVVTFGYVLSSGSVVERTNSGAQVVNSETLRSFLSLTTGTEKVIGTFNRVHDVEQYNGMPIFANIPVIKYIFGATSHSKALTRYIVTVSADPVSPDANLSKWAGEVVTDAEELIVKK